MARTFSATWICRTERRAMNSCMLGYATQSELDAARADFFAGAEARRAEWERKELRKKEGEKFFREWWDLDERERIAAEKAQSSKTRRTG